ncbi:MAG: type I restriction endonuclease subunit R, partial [Chloroflexota bacterium]|nr:type I restriction endonuclease subunit R [Chloroflexota bacterium]
MTVAVTESTAEAAALSWFAGLGYQTLYGPDVGPGEPGALRDRWDEVVLLPRLRPALERINPDVPPEAIEETVRQVLRVDSPSIVANNRRLHRLLADGVDVEYHGEKGELARSKVWLVDYVNPEGNDWLAMNQFTIEGHSNRRPDVVVFINGLPLGLLELKNPTDPNATIRTAYNQLQTYKQEIPDIFTYNEVLVISDGLEARAGTLTSPWERFQPWRTVDGAEIAPKNSLELKVLIQGMFDKARFLDLVRHFVLFETDGANTSKKLAAYHQYHAVNKAVEATVAATAPEGDRRAGVLWHTQGSGKSISMVFYAGKLATNTAMGNPTLVVLTDTNDLDDQLFDQFAASSELLRQSPVQAESRAHLREVLRRGSGGIVFTTVQKFLPDPGERYPALSERRNIVFLADEAHRSQYGFISGYARHMRDALPNASFVGFTGTPVELGDRSTTSVFGDYIDTYDIALSEEDGNTVPIYYEGRLAELDLSEAERPRLDPDFEEATEGEEVERREKLKTKWARLEAMVGSSRRIELVARDIVEHFDRRQEAIEGKAMIVCMSRRICVDLYDAITRLRPQWHAEGDAQGAIKVVMTGSATDPPEWQWHIRNKPRRSEIAARFKDP